jgi:hypothetical protein
MDRYNRMMPHKLRHLALLHIIFPIFLALLVGCETDAQRYEHEQAKVRCQVEAIPVGQPITQTNADILASTYWRYCPSCGAVSPVRDGGQYWSAHVVAGILPVDKPDILVEKATGYISWSRGPTITNWSQLWE